MKDSEWRRLSRCLEDDPEEEARRRRWVARLSGEPYLARSAEDWSALQGRAFRLEEAALRELSRDVSALRGRDPRWTPLAAFLGDRAAAEALGVQADPPRDFEPWVECLHYWGGGEAHLRAAVAVACEWSVVGHGLTPVIRAACRYVAAPGRVSLARYMRAAQRDRFRSPGGGVQLCHPPPATILFLERVLEAARGRGGGNDSLRRVIREALLRWVRGGSSAPSPPSSSIR